MTKVVDSEVELVVVGVSEVDELVVGSGVGVLVGSAVEVESSDVVGSEVDAVVGVGVGVSVVGVGVSDVLVSVVVEVDEGLASWRLGSTGAKSALKDREIPFPCIGGGAASIRRPWTAPRAFIWGPRLVVPSKPPVDHFMPHLVWESPPWQDWAAALAVGMR